MTSEHDKLINALIQASFSWQDADDTSTDVALIKELWEEVVAARKALVDYIEQRTLTPIESGILIEAVEFASPIQLEDQIVEKLRLLSSK